MNEQDSPILALTKRLAGDNWREAFEILLSHPGDSCDTGRPDRGFAAVENLIFGLRLEGKQDAAAELRQLVRGLDGDDDGLLFLLAECTKNIGGSAAKAGPFPVAPVPTVKPEDNELRNMFAFQAHEESKPSDVLPFTTSQPLGESKNFLWNASKSFSMEDEPQGRAPVLKSIENGAVEKRKAKRRKPISAPQPDLARHMNIKLDESELPEDAREILHLLINGPSLADVNARQRLLDASLLRRFPPGSEGLTDRAACCGILYQNLVDFSTAHSIYSKRVLSSVVKFCQSLTQTYLLRILEFLKSKTTCENYASALVFAAEKSKDDMLATLEILRDIEVSEGSACEILDIVSAALPKSHAMPIVEQLFLAALSPYVEMIWDWVFYGSSTRDVGGEFFGSTLGTKVTDSERLVRGPDDGGTQRGTFSKSCVPHILSMETALFILRAGRSRRLLEYLRPSDPLLHLDPPKIAKPFSFRRLDQVACELVHLASNQALENSSSSLVCVPSASEATLCSSEISGVPTTQEEDTVSEQKKMRFFALPEEEPTEDCVVSSGEVFPFSDSYSSPEAKPMPNEDNWRLETGQSAQFYFERAVAGNMRKVDMFSQRKILNHFVQELKMFDHLRFLGDFALLGAGDFANVLAKEICDADATSSEHEKFITRRVSAARTFYGSSGAGGATLRKRRHLQACLRVALSAAGTDHGPLSENFSISIDDSEIHKSSLWGCFIKVGYVVEFPLNLIISPEVLNLYSKFFNFFLSIRRAQLSLRTLFISTRRRSVLRGAMKPRDTSAQSMRRCRIALWQFCWHAEHFVSIVGGYEFNQIHGLSWADFQASWKRISSIWELRDEHLRYLQDSIRRVLLGEKQKSVMNVISGALNIIFDVESRIIRDASPVDLGNADLEELLSTATDGLKRRSTFLIDVLEKLVAAGAHPHLEDFLTRLNFNSFYKQKAY